ncbi:hypothetical protein PV326_004799 [Microctonus aethiopoides]|nr:hypothetical protein PV326_004799 [Microctonus aethiopoides]
MFVNIRRRIFPIVLLGFICLTLFTYYCTTVDDYHAFLQSGNTSNTKYIHRSQEYMRILPTPFISSKNTTNDSILISNTSITRGNITTDSFSTSLGPQFPSSASTSINLKITNDTTPHMNNISKPRLMDAPVIAVPILIKKNNTVSSIYPQGHSVAVPENCPNNGEAMDLVIVIMSAPSHFEARMGIRQTWGHYSLRTDISIVFILGTTNNTKLEAVLKREQKLYADIIRGNFVDSYSNLTLKTISMLEWVNKYCSRAKFLLKTDDDMFINIPRLLSFAMKHKKDVNVIFGRVAKKWKPYRNKQSKYYVPPAQFNGTVFPDFTTGPAYLLSRDVIDRLYNTAMNQTFMKLEDVFITGIIAAKLGIKRVHAGEFLNKKISYQPCTIQHGISIHMVKYGEQFDIWKKLLDGKSKCK